MSKLLPVDEFDLVIFGGTGDLAMRKLLPALYHRHCDQQFVDNSRIIAVGRNAIEPAEFLRVVKESLRSNLKTDEFNSGHWDTFERRLEYVQANATDTVTWAKLSKKLEAREERVRVFYLATSPALFGSIASGLQTNRLITAKSRIVLEKPLGRDGASAALINDAVGECFDENQIFRIDHYLGKETVQNLLALRFANSLFEPLWRRGTVDHVQITVAEELGVGNRVEYFDGVGTLRDMVQNHLLQLVCLVAMEAPTTLHHDAVRDEKLKVLRALKPITGEAVSRNTVRAQYSSGAIGSDNVPGFLEELGNDSSDTETFVALKLEVDNWRWSGVPFYVRTGKRLKQKHAEIVVQLQEVPHSIFPEQEFNVRPNRLRIRLQPDEGVTLSVMAKEPGPGGFDLRPVSLNLSFEETFGAAYPDAYERLLMEVLRGNPALFMRRDEVETAWRWVDDVVAGWESSRQKIESYVSGSWGPSAAFSMLDRDGRTWLPEG